MQPKPATMQDLTESGAPLQDDAPPSAGAAVVSLGSHIEQARKARRVNWPEAVRALLDAVQAGEVGALFTPDGLDTLRGLERQALPQWVEVKDELRRARVPMADLAKAMRGTSSAAPAPTRGEGATKKAKKSKPVNFGDVNRLTENFALLYGTDTVWDGESRQIMKVNALRLAFGNDAVKMWLGDKARRLVPIQNVVFEPGQDVGPDHINLYDGRPVEPEPGDCSVMIELLGHLCSESATSDTGVAAVMDWVLRWIAYPLQHPGAKLQTALVFHGAQGTGKNLFFDCVRDLYGDYGVMVSQNELEDKFTSWLSRKLFIVGDEVVTRAEMYHKKNQLKWLVTADKKIPIRAIQQDVRHETNHVNLVFLSNESQPLALEDGDRRYLVVYTPNKGPEDLYQRAAAFLKSGGARKFLHYLLTLDLGDFVPSTKPLMTQAKADLIELGLKPAERFVSEWLAGFLPLPVRPCSAEQVFQAFRKWCDKMGERAWTPQATFTKTLERWVLERSGVDDDGYRMAPRLAYKVVKLAHEDGGRKCVRCWIPEGTGPVNGETEGQWMAGCVQAFQPVLDRFCRAAGKSEGDE
jgi:putative DNA primase/helicase